MGKLAKAFALDRESSRFMPFDEQQLLRDAGQIAARLRSELDRSSEPPKSRAEPDDLAQTLADLHLAFQTGDDSAATSTHALSAELDRREAELSQREAALGHSVQAALVALKLRSERELREQSLALEADWTARNAALTREQGKWAAHYDEQQAELRELRQSVESDAAANRSVSDEQDALRLRLEAQLRDIETVQQETLSKTRGDIAAIVELERAKLETQRAELDRQTREQSESLWQKRREFEVDLNQLRAEWLSEHEAARRQAEQELSAFRTAGEHEQRELHAAIEQWHAQRADEAVLLREERQQIDATRQAVEAAQQKVAAAAAALATERQELLSELDRQRSDFERERTEHRATSQSEISRQQDALQQRTAEFEASISQREQALELRERLFVERSAQQDSDWSARCRSVEHDQRLQAELTQQRMAEERAYFDAECVRRESALADELAADRADIARERRQLEEERNQVRHSVQQMDRQLRLIASNIESPAAIGLRFDDASLTVPAPHLLEAVTRPVETVRVVANRATDDEADPRAEATAARRRALEQYREMLGELQVQVNELVVSRESRVASNAGSAPD